MNQTRANQRMANMKTPQNRKFLQGGEPKEVPSLDLFELVRQKNCFFYLCPRLFNMILKHFAITFKYFNVRVTVTAHPMLEISTIEMIIENERHRSG